MSLEESPIDGISSTDAVLIALMGTTGAGKSTFIRKVTGRDDIQVGHGLTSETLECKAYHFQNHGVDFSLIDTPGFNDTYLDDAAILAQLAAFMEKTYRAKAKLTAIIYLHPIINDRLEGSALDNLSMFRKLCGPGCYPNIVLATSFWSCIDQNVGSQREKELRETDEFWGGMIHRGSQMIRLPAERQQSIDLLLTLAKKDKIVLQIQNELVDRGLSLSHTEAGASARNTRALEALKEEFSNRLAELVTEKNLAIERQRAEFEMLRAKQEDEFERKLRKHKEELDRVRKEHDELLKTAEDKRQKVLKEQAELTRQTEIETSRIRAELERLALEDKQREESRKQEQMSNAFSLKLAIFRAKLATHESVLEAALKSKTIKQPFNPDWLNSFLAKACNICLHPTPVQLSYTCTSCDDVDICPQCFEEGNHCIVANHITFARRSFTGTPAGVCKRARKPVATRYLVPCDRCGRILDGLYLHCCSCGNDNYEICLDCFCKGKTCLNLNHTVHLMGT